MVLFSCYQKGRVYLKEKQQTELVLFFGRYLAENIHFIAQNKQKHGGCTFKKNPQVIEKNNKT